MIIEVYMCGHCAGPVKKDQTRCDYCGYYLKVPDKVVVADGKHVNLIKWQYDPNKPTTKIHVVLYDHDSQIPTKIPRMDFTDENVNLVEELKMPDADTVVFVDLLRSIAYNFQDKIAEKVQKFGNFDTISRQVYHARNKHVDSVLRLLRHCGLKQVYLFERPVFSAFNKNPNHKLFKLDRIARYRVDGILKPGDVE